MGLNLNKQTSAMPLRPGSRVELISMDDPYTKLKQGDQGTVDFIDDANVIHVNWDNGSSLGLLDDVDQYKVLNENENEYRPFPKGEERNQKIGDRNAKLYQQAEDKMISEDGEGDTIGDEEEEVDPYEGQERRFRVSIYADIHVPMTANLEHDRQVAEQEASNILKKFKFDSMSNAHNPFASIPDPKEFGRL